MDGTGLWMWAQCVPCAFWMGIPVGTSPGACVGACCVYSSLSWGPALGWPQFCRTQGKAFDIAIGQVRFPPAACLLVSAACVSSAMLVAHLLGWTVLHKAEGEG